MGKCEWRRGHKEADKNKSADEKWMAGNQKMSEMNTWTKKKKGKNSWNQVKWKVYLQLGTT